MVILSRHMYPCQLELESIGFKFGETVGKSGIKAEFPKGWSLGDRNGYEVNILDEKGRIRGYNRVHHGEVYGTTLQTRYRVDVKDISPEQNNSLVKVFAIDTVSGEWLFEAGTCDLPYHFEMYRELRYIAQKFLDKKFPNWTNPLAYW